jgi:hypothetical protein
MFLTIATVAWSSTAAHAGCWPCPLRPGMKDRDANQLQAQVDAAIAAKQPTFTVAGGRYNFSANFKIDGATKFAILAPDPVEILFQGSCYGVNISRSVDLSLGNLSIDYLGWPKASGEQVLHAWSPPAPAPFTGCITFNLMDSTRVHASDVTLHGGKSMLLTAFNGGGDHRFTRFNFSSSLGRMTRDAVHFSDQRIGATIEDSVIGYSGDDLLNIHTTLMVVLKCETRSSCLILNPHLKGVDFANTDYHTNTVLRSMVNKDGHKDTMSFHSWPDEHFVTTRRGAAPALGVKSLVQVTDKALLSEAATLPKSTAGPKVNPVFMTNTTVGWQAWDLWRVEFDGPLPPGVASRDMVQIDTISNGGTRLLNTLWTDTNCNLGRYKSINSVVSGNTFRNARIPNFEISWLPQFFEGPVIIKNVTMANNVIQNGGAKPLHCGPWCENPGCGLEESKPNKPAAWRVAKCPACPQCDRRTLWTDAIVLQNNTFETLKKVKTDDAAVNASAWCPLWHNIYQKKMYDPSAPIRLKDGTWHMYPDGCDGGWCHYSSPDLFHWTQQAPLGKLGGLTGSISYTQEVQLLLLHPKGGDWIGRAVPNGTDANKLNDFDDSSVCTSNVTTSGCVATAPGHKAGIAAAGKWPDGLNGNFMDPSRAVRLRDGRWYITCGAGCMGACKSPRDDGKVGVPWFRATNASLLEFELAGYLFNVTSSLGSLHSNTWLPSSLPCHFQACPDVFPLGEDPELFVFISSVYPAWTNEWWIGKIKEGLGHFDEPAFQPIAGAHGVLDYGGVYAAKTGADQVVDQRESTRRVMFSSTGWQRNGVPGCDPQQTMPRDLGLVPGAVPRLSIDPAREVATLRQGKPTRILAKAGQPPVQFRKTGSQVEVLVSCSGLNSESSVTATVLQSIDGVEGVPISYFPANRTLSVNHRKIIRTGGENLLQNAPVPAALAANSSAVLRVLLDGGMIETFLSSEIAITSLVKMPTDGSPSAPPTPPAKNCKITTDLGCRNETDCGGDPKERCLPNLMRSGTAGTRTACAAECAGAGFKIAGVEIGQCWCGHGPIPARCAVAPKLCPRGGKGGHCAVSAFEFKCSPAPPPGGPGPLPPPPPAVDPPAARGVSVRVTGGGSCAVTVSKLALSDSTSNA